MIVVFISKSLHGFIKDVFVNNIYNFVLSGLKLKNFTMKKQIILSSIALVVFSSAFIIGCTKSQNQTSQTSNLASHAAADKLVTVTHGANQPNGGCAGTGTECKLTTVTDPFTADLTNPPVSGGTWAYANINGSNQLVVTFFKAYMDQAWLDEFSNGSCNVEADNTVGSDIMEELTGVTDDTYIISQGTYSYTEDDDYFYVTF